MLAAMIWVGRLMFLEYSLPLTLSCMLGPLVMPIRLNQRV